MTTFLKVNGERITDAGLILRVDSETKTRVRGTVVDVFFPVHETRWGTYQVTGGRADYLREILMGQKREFWSAGTRFGYEVGGMRWVSDWCFEQRVAA
jgi:hypothetical protein